MPDDGVDDDPDGDDPDGVEGVGDGPAPGAGDEGGPEPSELGDGVVGRVRPEPPVFVARESVR